MIGTPKSRVIDSPLWNIEAEMSRRPALISSTSTTQGLANALVPCITVKDPPGTLAVGFNNGVRE